MPIIVYDYEIGLDFHIITLRVSVYINEVFLICTSCIVRILSILALFTQSENSTMVIFSRANISFFYYEILAKINENFYI